MGRVINFRDYRMRRRKRGKRTQHMTPIEFAQAYATVRTAAEYVKSLVELSKDVKVNQVAIDLQSTILDLQSRLSEIQAKYNDLYEIKRKAEQKLVEHEDWNSEAS